MCNLEIKRGDTDKMKITLENINEVTLQQIFHQAARHLLQQNKKSQEKVGNVTGICLYRSGELMCAAGVFISDKDYTYGFEGEYIDRVVNRLIYNITSDKLKLLRRLQIIHDSCTPREWSSKLLGLAVGFNLTNFSLIYQKPEGTV